MSYGPVDFEALEFKGHRFKGEILHQILASLNRDIARLMERTASEGARLAAGTTPQAAL